MDANELRIGNLIQWEDDSHDIVKITGIYIPINVKQYGYFVDYREILSKENPKMNNGCAMLSEFIPISLTEEWLIKLGMKRNLPIELEQDEYNNLFFMHKRGEIKVKYVHQLQNIYFDINGEELTYK